MSKSKPKKSSGYKPVECASLEKEINGDSHPTPVMPIKAINPYHIAGTCKLSTSGQSFSIRLQEGDKYRHFTILRSDIVSLLTGSDLTVALVREYDNSNTPTTIILKSNLILGS